MTTTGGGSVNQYQTKTGRKWEVRWRSDQGASKRKKGFATKREAQAWLAQNRVQRQTGTYIDPQAGRVVVGALWPDWLAGQAHIKATTRATREGTWSKHVEPRWAEVEIRSIRPSQVRAWVGQMIEGGAGVATVENALGVLRGVLAVAVEDRLIPTNPASGIKAPRRTPKPQRFLTHEQVAALATECGAGGLIVEVLAYTGIRAGELAALRVADVDYLRGRISVSRSVSYVRGRGMVESATKTYEARSIPVPRFLIEPLSVQAQGRALDDYLFGTRDGQPWVLGNWRRRVYRPAVDRCRVQDATFPAVTVHDLRHSCASLAVQAGGTLAAVSRMLGHASPAVTAEVYTGLFSSDLDSLARGLERHREVACGLGVASTN